jgi:hypothetical protein
VCGEGIQLGIPLDMYDPYMITGSNSIKLLEL